MKIIQHTYKQFYQELKFIDKKEMTKEMAAKTLRENNTLILDIMPFPFNDDETWFGCNNCGWSHPQ